MLKTGDGLLATVQTVRAVKTSGKSLAQWCDEVELLPQALANIPLQDRSLLDQPEIKSFIAVQNERLGNGRLLIRPSGTEPLARVMVEAPNAQAEAEQIAKELQEFLAGSLGQTKTPFPITFSDTTMPLTEAMFGDAGADLVRQLSAKGYEVHTGLTPKFADDIAKMCLQPSIKEYCPNDAGRRFANRAATEHWLGKGRCAFLLLKRETGNNLSLAGYGWAGLETNSHIPGGESTFALRIGEDDQGQGLATPFARLIVAGTAKLFGSKNMWLETWASDGAAVHIYHKLGFEDVDQEPGERPTASGETVTDTRLYMSLPNHVIGYS